MLNKSVKNHLTCFQALGSKQLFTTACNNVKCVWGGIHCLSI